MTRELSGLLPEPGAFTDADAALCSEGELALQVQLAAFERFDLNAAAFAPLRLLAATNRYVDAEAPWALSKGGDRERLGTVLYVAVEAVGRAAWLLGPVVPRASNRVREALGGCEAATANPGGVHWNPLASGSPVGLGDPLFPKRLASGISPA